MFAALVEDLSLVPVVMPHLYFQPHTGSDALSDPSRQLHMMYIYVHENSYAYILQFSL